MINIYAIINGINGVASLAAASIILFSKSRKPVQLGHGLFSLLLFSYAFPYFLWGIQTHKEYASFFLPWVIYACCFIQAGYFHYVLILSDAIKKYKRFLITGYAISAILAWMNYRGLFYDSLNLRVKGPFLFWPHGKACLPILIFAMIFYVVFALVILWRASQKTSGPTKINLRGYLIISVIGWIGGLTNWFLFWDGISLLPIGNLGVSLLIVGTYYLIFKRDFLELSGIVKKTFVYALLTFFISLIYAGFILMGEKVSRVYFGYSSFFASLLAGLVIALLFNPVRALLNRLINKIIFGKDITEFSVENLKMQLELEKQDRMKAVSTLAAGMAHEIKNPITAIRTFAEFLPKKYEDPEFRNKFSSLLIEETDRISAIVRDLLLFARPGEPVIGPCNVAKILGDVTDLLKGDLFKYSIVLEFGIASEPIMCLADSSQIKQALLNIIMNAIDAMKDKVGDKRLLIDTRRTNEGIEISIADTGVGIAPGKIPHLFDPFYTDKKDGTGLGLAITQAIIEKNHGSIRVESAVAQGTKFILLLPTHK